MIPIDIVHDIISDDEPCIMIGIPVHKQPYPEMTEYPLEIDLVGTDVDQNPRQIELYVAQVDVKIQVVYQLLRTSGDSIASGDLAFIGNE